MDSKTADSPQFVPVGFPYGLTLFNGKYLATPGRLWLTAMRCTKCLLESISKNAEKPTEELYPDYQILL